MDLVSRLQGRSVGVGVLALLAVLTLGLGLALRRLAVDDAFVTYRYAHNLAVGYGFVYNAGQPVLSTTAPLYALLLAAGAWAWPDLAALPIVANAISALAIGVGALLLFVLGRQDGNPWIAALAALFYVLYPLPWLSLGLETAMFVALALAAVVMYRRGRLYLSAALLAAATLTRGDGLILVGVLAVHWLVGHMTCDTAPEGLGTTRPRLRIKDRALRRALGAVGLYLGVMLPMLAWLAWKFGSPLPATLAAKRAQTALGITGFYAHTTYLQGLAILARARLAQNLLYLLFLPAVLVGMVAMVRRAVWVVLLVAWGTAHLLGYILLGVTPYYWYYAPLVPGMVSLTALGIVEGVRWLGRRGIRKPGSQAVGVVWAGLLLLALVRSDGAMVQALEGPVPPPEESLSKVLPEAKGDVYEMAGRWLHECTPPEAVVGVTEVGILGYYSGRHMVDFLGLLEPDVAQALARGDLYWALLRYQPDYLVLTSVSPLYAYDLRADPWFQAAYAPAQSFDDARFWGSPLTIYRRQIEPVPLLESAADRLPTAGLRLDANLGGQIRLLGAVTMHDEARPGEVLSLTLYWSALGPVQQDYTVFVHLLGQHDRVLAQRDATPGLGARPTSGWTPDQVVADPYLLALPEAAYAPDEAVWEVGLYAAATGQRLPVIGGGDNVRFGHVTVQPSDGRLHLDFGPVALVGYDLDRLALASGETLNVTLLWTGSGPASVSVQLVSEQGDVVALAGGDSSQAAYALSLPVDAPPGAYELEVLVTDPATGATLPLLGADGQPRDDRATLTKVRYYPEDGE